MDSVSNYLQTYNSSNVSKARATAYNDDDDDDKQNNTLSHDRQKEKIQKSEKHVGSKKKNIDIFFFPPDSIFGAHSHFLHFSCCFLLFFLHIHTGAN